MIRDLPRISAGGPGPAGRGGRAGRGTTPLRSSPSFKLHKMLRSSVLLASVAAVLSQNSTCSGTTSIYDGTFKSNYINGTAFNYTAYAGQVLMITNVASF